MQPTSMKRFALRWYRDNSVVVHFWALTGWLWLMQYFFLQWESTSTYLNDVFPAMIARWTATCIGLLGYETVANGPFVNIVGRFGFSIAYHCAGIFGMIIFISAVIAFPSTIKEKVIGVALGIPLLNLVNVVRISILGIVGIYSRAIFDFCHYWLLQGVFIAFVIVLWLLWRIIFVRSAVGSVVPS